MAPQLQDTLIKQSTTWILKNLDGENPLRPLQHASIIVVRNTSNITIM
jgi:hypothetical protein